MKQTRTLLFTSAIFLTGMMIKAEESSIQTSEPAYIRRAILDIGSVGTKLQVVDIDPKTNAIKKDLIFTELPVGYKADLIQQKNPTCFTEATIQKGIKALKDLKALANTLTPPPTQYLAVATAGFRAASCSNQLIDRFVSETGIPLVMVTQDEEARLGFNGVVARSGSAPEHVVSWESGGGSMQMVTALDNGELLIYGTAGFIPFKNLVITSVKHKSLGATRTPNPFSFEDAYKAIRLAEVLAQTVPQAIKDKIKKSDTKILCTGSIVNVVRVAMKTSQRSTFTREEIEQGLYTHLLGLTDQDVARDPEAGLDTSITISGLTLVLGFMKALDITTITIVEGGMREGALLDPLYFTATCVNGECTL